MSALGLAPGQFGDPWFVDRQAPDYLAGRSSAQAAKDQRLPRWGVRQKYRTLTGHRAEISASGKTKGEAKAKLDRKRALVAAAFAPPPTAAQMLFKDAAAGWLAHRAAEGLITPQTLKKYERTVELDLTPIWGPRLVAEITTDELDAVRHAVIKYDTHRSKPGPKGNGACSRAYLLLEETGVRIGEVLGLRRQDIYLEGPHGPYVYFGGSVVENTGVKFHRQDHTKSENRWAAEPGRRIGISQDLAEGLRVWMANATFTSPSDPVFATRNGTWIRPSNFRKWLKSALGTEESAPVGMY